MDQKPPVHAAKVAPKADPKIVTRPALPGRAATEHRRPMKQGESFRPKGSLTTWSAR